MINGRSIKFSKNLLNRNMLTLFRMGIFGADHTYPTMMKLGTVISYLTKIQKIYESRDTPPEFC